MSRPLALAAALAALCAAVASSYATDAGNLPTPQSFRHPGRAAGVHAWWHWMDGAITKDGITKDLEVMKAQGVSEATILNIGLFDGRDFGVPRIVFASPEWFAMYRWALDEAARLGITIGVHNCDGWSSSGGPWITPEQSMKQFTWTKTLVRGGVVDVMLPKPAEVSGFYRDVAVLAYRTQQKARAQGTGSLTLQVNGRETPASVLADGSPVSALPVKLGDQLTLSSATPMEFSRLALHLRRSFSWSNPAEFVTRFAVEISDDGKTFRTLGELNLQGLNRTEIFDLPPSAARILRLTIRETNDTNAWLPLLLGEFEILKAGETPIYAPTIPFVGEKTGAIKAGTDGAVDTLGTDAGAIARGDIVVLTDKLGANGHLRWQAPEGDWAILRFGYTSTGSTNGPATKEGSGLECDKMDAAVVEHHFRAFPEKLINEAGEHAGKTMRFIFMDSWEAGFQNWTASLPAEFEKRHGYSLLSWLPALTGETVSSAAESEAVLFDFRSTIADLIRENYYEKMAALLHARGIEFHAEVIYGGSEYPPLDILRSTKDVDLPMFEFWTSTNKDYLIDYKPSKGPFLNLPVNAAACYGKPLVGSEAYTGYAHYSESPADLKPFGDQAFASGINRMILHSSVHQPSDWKPGMTLGQFASHFNRGNLYWNHAASWMEYQTRIQSWLGLGAPVADILHFLGDQLPEALVKDARTDLPVGYSLTAVNADVLATRVRVDEGRLLLNDGGDAAILTLPPQPTMNLETLKLLESLISAGARVYGPRPERPLSLADGKKIAEFQALAERIWGKVDGKTVLSANYGKGSVHWGRTLPELLNEIGLKPQFAALPAMENELLFVHRRVEGTEVFFVANQQDKAIDRECLFRVGDKVPEIWNPETGEVNRPAAFYVEGEQLRLPLHFKARQAFVFVFRPVKTGLHITSIAKGADTLFPAAGLVKQVPAFSEGRAGIAAETLSAGDYALGLSDGSVKNATLAASSPLMIAGLHGTLELSGPGYSAKAPIEIHELGSLTDYAAAEIRYFSGTAVYRLQFVLPELGQVGTDSMRLDIGDFEAVAELALNGQSLGQFWRPGSTIDVTRLVKEKNELTVTVVTTYRNRMIGDLAEFGELKNLKTSSPLQQFLSAKSVLKRSGLIGPITITRVPKQTLPGVAP